MNEPVSPSSRIWVDYQRALLGSSPAIPAKLKCAIERTIGTRHPSGLIFDADNRLGVTTTALLDSGYEVLSLAADTEAEQSISSSLSEYGDRVRVTLCPFGTAPSGLSSEPDGIVAFTDALSLMGSHDAIAAMFQTYFDLLRPGGSILLAHSDFDRLFATDPDTALSDPILSGTEDEPTVLLERRKWRGDPRARTFTADYLRLTPTGAADSFSADILATPLTELSDMTRLAGFVADHWKSPEETGYHRPLLLATKPPAPIAFYPPSPLDIPAAASPPPPDHAPETKFVFYPEDMDRNPFEEAPDDRTRTRRLAPKPGARGQAGKQVSLVMLSGGIDSVYVLQRLLQESDDEIIAHHIHFVNREGRHKAEDIACKRIVAHLRRAIRPFHYTESTIDRRRFQSFGMDDMCVGFEVGVISNSFQANRGYPIDRWTSGTCLEEELEYYGGTELERFEHVLSSAAASSYPSPAPRYFQLKIIPKQDQLDYMGQPLVDLCWTCRTPVWNTAGEPSECGTCKTCTLMENIRRGEVTIRHKPEKRP